MDNQDPSPRPGVKMLACRHFFTGSGLPAFVLAATFVYEAFLMAIILTPQGLGGWSRFATEFKVWCFSYDPRTGGMEWAAVWMMLLEPAFIAALVVILWRSSVRNLMRPVGLAKEWRALLSGSIVAVTVVTGLFAYGSPESDVQELPPFPGERIRTELAPPGFRLVDQKGKAFGLEDARGSVVLITGIYGFCSTACPQILMETKAVLESLPERAREAVSVVALSLDPEHDSESMRNQVADGYGYTYPKFRYLNGDPEVVRPVLADFGFSRTLNSRTGIIDHTNLFVLIDSEGKIAYRFTVDSRHRPWLQAALLHLADEIEESDS